MAELLIVVDKVSDWAAYYPSESLVTFDDYLNFQQKPGQRVRIINLCQNYKYGGEGYYCSLLAEARNHHVLPSVSVLNDLGSRNLYRLELDELAPALDKALKGVDKASTITVKSYFGRVDEVALKDVARLLFERFPCPILELSLRFGRKTWEVTSVKIRNHKGLTETEETAFAEALDSFNKKVWRKLKKRKNSRFDLAILVNPKEEMPPSNAAAIKRFVAAGKELGVDVEILGPRDSMRIPEFDALFIRETTAIDHHTYRFAKMAEGEGLVVLDDPTSIIRCTNKIYLADLFKTNKVPAPKTLVLKKNQPRLVEDLIEKMGLPLVLKIPDGSFSRGVVKVKDEAELRTTLESLFKQSSLLLAQEFLYTEYDWRIGVLNRKAIYACRYYMVKNHWQIYHHGTSKTTSGAYDTLPTFEVPKKVIEAALKATQQIGDGIYGVDVKESKGQGYVIEVNDNPNIDCGVEDKYLGKELYTQIMQEFVRRMELRRQA